MYGMGVTSMSCVMRRPVACRDCTAYCLFPPVPFSFTATEPYPALSALRASSSAAFSAATGWDLRAFRKPTVAAEVQALTLPDLSQSVRMMLLKVLRMLMTPSSAADCSLRRRRVTLRAP